MRIYGEEKSPWNISQLKGTVDICLLLHFHIHIYCIKLKIKVKLCVKQSTDAKKLTCSSIQYMLGAWKTYLKSGNLQMTGQKNRSKPNLIN